MRTPHFVTDSMQQAQELSSWLISHFEELKSKASEVSQHCKLIGLEPWFVGPSFRFLPFFLDMTLYIKKVWQRLSKCSLVVLFINLDDITKKKLRIFDSLIYLWHSPPPFFSPFAYFRSESADGIRLRFCWCRGSKRRYCNHLARMSVGLGVDHPGTTTYQHPGILHWD